MARILEYVEVGGIEQQTPKHERRIERHRRERVAREAIWPSLSVSSSNDRHAGRIGSERIAKVPRSNRRTIASEFVGRIGTDRVPWRVIHPVTSESQIVGRQTKYNPTVTGTRSVEIE